MAVVGAVILLLVLRQGPASAAALSVSDRSVEPGTTIEVTGTCTPRSDQEQVAIVASDAIGGSRLVEVSPDSDGRFSASVQIPDGFDPGTGTLTAQCGLAEGQNPTAPLTVAEIDESNPSMMVEPASVEAGDRIEVSGTCTPRSDRTDIRIVAGGDLDDLLGGQLDVVQTDESGEFSAGIDIPVDAPTGSGTVSAECGLEDVEDPQVILTVEGPDPAPSLAVSPYTVKAGSTVDIAGSCTPAADRSSVALILGGDLQDGRLATVTAGPDGSFAASVDIPADAGTGSGFLAAACGLGTDLNPVAGLTIIPPAPRPPSRWSPTPYRPATPLR